MTSEAELQKHYKRFNRLIKESGGICTMSLITHDDVDFIGALLFGNTLARTLMRTIKQALKEVNGRLCLLCDHRFVADEQPPAFVIISPGAIELNLPDDMTLAAPICRQCRGQKSRDELFATCVQMIPREWPDIRVTAVHPEPDQMM